MSTLRLIGLATIPVFAALYFASGWFADPGPRPLREQRGWFEVPGDPVAVDNAPVESWEEVNSILRYTSHEARTEVEQRSYTRAAYEALPDRLDSRHFTIVVREPGDGVDGQRRHRHVVVERWFLKRDLFSRSAPRHVQQFEILESGLH